MQADGKKCSVHKNVKGKNDLTLGYIPWPLAMAPTLACLPDRDILVLVKRQFKNQLSQSGHLITEMSQSRKILLLKCPDEHGTLFTIWSHSGPYGSLCRSQ